ncbi:MAG: PAS domain S-box protein [Terriglobia bacterium]
MIAVKQALSVRLSRVILAPAVFLLAPLMARGGTARHAHQIAQASTSPHAGWWMLAMGVVILVLALRLITLGSRDREYAEFVRRSMQRETLHERRYAELLDNSSDIVYTHGLDGKLITWSKAGEMITGYTQREVFQKSLAELAAPEHKEEVTRWLRQVADGRAAPAFELVLVARDGSRVTLDVSTRAVTQDGRTAGILGFARDMTARKRAEDALKESELRLRTVVNNVPVILFAADRAGVFTLCEGKGLAALGLKPGALAGRSVQDVDRFLPGIGRTFSRALAGETFTAIHEAGGLIYEGQVGPVRDSRGEIAGLIGIAAEVTERKKSEEAAEKARKAAEAASQAKSDFLANMSHEIRTPINGILGMTELALDTELTAEQREYLDTVRMSAEALMCVVTEILDFSKVEAGRTELDAAPFELRELLESTMKPLIARGRQKGLKVAWSVKPDTPERLIGDSHRLRQVVAGLVDNAIKFTSRGFVGAAVEAEFIDEEDVLLRFEVVDTGIGIPAEKQDAIFDPFVQADGSTTRRYGGAGLGLSIARRLVELMGGEMGVESEPGKGSTFYFTLPLALADGRDANSSRPGDDQVLAAAAADQDARALKILLAEDNPATQRLIRFLLRRQGHEVELAEDGAEALRAVREAAPHAFDLLLLGIQMPGMRAAEIVTTLRQDEKATGKHLPIVAVAGPSGKSQREQLLAAGVDGSISKPVRGHELTALVARYAGSARRRAPRPLEKRNPPFDPAECIKRAGGNRLLAREMAEIFLETCPQSIDALRSALPKGDREELGRALNTLESSLGALSEKSAYQAIISMQQHLRHGNSGALADTFAVLEAEVEKLRLALSAFLTDGSGSTNPQAPPLTTGGLRPM